MHRWIPQWLRPWLARQWFVTLLAIVVFAVLAAVFMAVSERKDSSYWAGYTDAQRWVHEGGYQAHDESITAYCHDRSAQQSGQFERGCLDGARNAMK
ncbi:hypothetical protein OG976_25225 [Mycobacterium sp. NBC_00419]|uniref:hypothetical protein n=1 Tax=Mycobacterium sp. NBC_00419 TaxID=2975989 RepID=UPI002E236F45